MRRTEIKKLINLEVFYTQVEQIAERCNCTLLEAVQEYGRIHDIDDALLAQIVKVSRGNFKTKMTAECEELRLIK